MINKAWTFLKGKKTFILTIAGFAYESGILLNYWPRNNWVELVTGTGLLASFRHGMDTAADKAAQKLSSVYIPDSDSKRKA